MIQLDRIFFLEVYEAGDTPAGVELVPNLIYAAEERAMRHLQRELASLGKPADAISVDAEITVVDADGRALIAARLDREPGTRRFHIVLLTENP